MAQETQFDALAYFERIAKANRLASEKGFAVGFCSGFEGLEDALAEFRTEGNFILIDDTTARNTFSSGVTFFDRNVYTVFILAGYDFQDMADRKAKMELCRRLFRQLHSRMIHDQEQWEAETGVQFLDVDTIASHELGEYALNGVTGLYFMVNNTEPVDLTYNEDEWLTEERT